MGTRAGRELQRHPFTLRRPPPPPVAGVLQQPVEPAVLGGHDSHHRKVLGMLWAEEWDRSEEGGRLSTAGCPSGTSAAVCRRLAAAPRQGLTRRCVGHPCRRGTQRVGRARPQQPRVPVGGSAQRLHRLWAEVRSACLLACFWLLGLTARALLHTRATRCRRRCCLLSPFVVVSTPTCPRGTSLVV